MHKYAVVAGVSSYGQGDGRPGSGAGTLNFLPGSVNSARSLAALLKSRGFRCLELYDGQATKANILSDIDGCYHNCTAAGDVVAIAFVGHGTRIAGIDHIVPVDVYPDDGSTHADRMIAAAEWQATIARRPAHAHTWVNLDCCYAGGDVAAFLATMGMRPRILHNPPTTSMLAADDAMASVAVTVSLSNLVQFTPCGPGQLSVEQRTAGGNWGSLWTDVTIEAMKAASSAHDTYQQTFNVASAWARHSYAGATPVCRGDAAMLAKPFLM